MDWCPVQGESQTVIRWGLTCDGLVSRPGGVTDSHLLGANLRWIGVLSRGSHRLSSANTTDTGDKRRSYEPLGLEKIPGSRYSKPLKCDLLWYRWSQSLDHDLHKKSTKKTPFRTPLRTRFGSVDTPSSTSKWSARVSTLYLLGRNWENEKTKQHLLTKPGRKETGIVGYRRTCHLLLVLVFSCTHSPIGSCAYRKIFRGIPFESIA